MKITVEVNGKPVEIELTKDQIAKVKKHTERPKTWADVLEYHGKSQRGFDEHFYELDEQSYANEQVKLIALALNEGVIMDPFNISQYKYYPRFEVKNGAFVFDVYYFWCGSTHVGSRLCYKNSELAEYAGKTFIDIYTKLLS